MSKLPATERTRNVWPDVTVRLGLVSAALLAYGVYFGWTGWGESWFSQKVPVPSVARTEQTNRIAFVGAEGDVWVMSPDGTALTALTSDGHGYRMPVWSPDGSRIAFLGFQTRDRQTALYVSPSDRSEPVMVFSQAGCNPFFIAWSPQGDRLLFLSSEAVTGGTFWQSKEPRGWRLVLRSIRIQQPQHSPIVAEGQPLYFNWSPKRDFLLLRSGAQLSVAPAFDLSQSRLLCDLPGQFNVPIWSVDGNRAFYLRQDGARPAVAEDSAPPTETLGAALPQQDSHQPRLASALVERDLNSDQERTVLTISGADPLRMVRSPKADVVAYQPLLLNGWSPGRRRQHAQILHLGSDQEPRSIGVAAWALFWSPDGSKLAVLTTGDPGNGSYIAAGGPRYVTWSIYRPDSDTVEDVYSFEPAESCRDIMSHFDQWSLATSVWSPDGRYLLANTRDGGGDAVWIVDSEGEEPARRIADGTYAAWSSR